MSINYCTITRSTTDSFCGARRSIVVAQLLRRKYPPLPGGAQGGSIQAGIVQKNTNNQKFLHDLRQRADVQDTMPKDYTLPQVTVEIKFNGIVQRQTADMQQRLSFVSIADVKIINNPEALMVIQRAMEKDIEPKDPVIELEHVVDQSKDDK